MHWRCGRVGGEVSADLRRRLRREIGLACQDGRRCWALVTFESGSKLRALHTLREGRRGRGEVRLAVWVGWRRS